MPTDTDPTVATPYRSYADRQALSIGEWADERIAQLEEELAAVRKVRAAAARHRRYLEAVETDDRVTECPVCSPWRHGFELTAEQMCDPASHTCGLSPRERIEYRELAGSPLSRFEAKERAAEKADALYRQVTR